ncbi:MAG: hypothetical protein L6V81_03785 [Clostridium sp.]|nr:MAG: hypothetical protein L6V81_03785 [Clostridium sp.]
MNQLKIEERFIIQKYPFFQNIVVGGKVNKTNVVGTIKLEYNPNTGVTNVALLFVVTMIAFGVGYLVLNYKKINLLHFN